MALPGETLGVKDVVCENCSTHIRIGVHLSGRGYYIGFVCPQCGPYSRESGYYKTMTEAALALIADNYGR